MLDDCRVLLSCLPAQVSGQAFTLDLGTRDLDRDIAITDCWSAPLVGAHGLITSRQHGSAPRSRAGMHSCEARGRWVLGRHSGTPPICRSYHRGAADGWSRENLRRTETH